MVLYVLLFILGCGSLPSHYVSLDTQMPSGLDEVFRKIEENRVIFIGEIHGTPSIHRLQLEIIRRLHEGGRPVSIAMEAFPSEMQHIFDKWTEGVLNENDFQRVYKETWTVPYDYYREILLYARAQKIPLIAINADNALIGSVSKNGLGAVSEDLLKEVGFTACTTDPAYEKIVGKTYHAAEFPFLCDGQRLRDSFMAYNISKALKKDNNAVIVLAGATHAMKPAVPHLLSNLTRVGYKVLLPASIQRVIKRPPDINIADFIWDE
jgi:uncharacterized iron-regulated protein